MSNNEKVRNIFAKKLKYYITSRGISQQHIVEALDVSKASVSGWCNGTKMPRMDKVEKLADMFNISISDLVEEKLDDVKIACTPAGQRIGHLYDKAEPRDKQIVETVLEPYDDGKPIPEQPPVKLAQFPKTTKRNDGFTEIKVYDQPAAAGLGNYLDEPSHHIEQYPSYMVPSRVDFGIQISGDSMEPRIKNGSTVFVHACVSIDPGKIGIFILNSNAYCKKLVVDLAQRQVRLVSVNTAYEDIIIHECDEFRTVGLVL